MLLPGKVVQYSEPLRTGRVQKCLIVLIHHLNKGNLLNYRDYRDSRGCEQHFFPPCNASEAGLRSGRFL
ncbi:MAG: hypothetical protein DRI57_05200 [Deltaproteobacteria bacterium]|nr:MAG: hypothetical protein DRI57_05200 [Deltaproteobacteria bacterium]